jgi:hypothetical protein
MLELALPILLFINTANGRPFVRAELHFMTEMVHCIRLGMDVVAKFPGTEAECRRARFGEIPADPSLMEPRENRWK